MAPIMGTIIKDQRLSSALFGKTRLALLALFFTNPEREFYFRELTRLTGAGQGAVQRELKRLSEAGIISKSSRGREVYYKANRRCPIFSELHKIIIKTAGLAQIS